MSAKTAKSKTNYIHITRVYDAPVKLVWDAWTDPQQVAQWWGPRGFTITTHSKDLRPGGHWRYTMHGPDGVDYPNNTIYYEVEECARLVYDHGGYEDRPPLFRVTVEFKESRGKTTMDMRMTLPTPEAAEQIRGFIKQAGGNSTWDRLGEYLEKHVSGKDQFQINRTFDAPLETVFDMWTDPKHIVRWLPPTGFEMRYLRADIRAGGNSFYVMSNSEGMTMYGRAEYLQIERPHRVVYTQQFCDEQEKLSRHPMLPTFPATLLTTITLVAEGPDETRVTVTFEPYGAATPEEIEVFIQTRAGMTLGWTGSFDKLEELLSAEND